MTDPIPGDTEAPDAPAEGAHPSQAGAPPACGEGSEPIEWEGPRRRARRERADRRAAQARARAIEEARREAKRKAFRLPSDTKPAARGTVRGLKLLLWAVLVSVCAVGLGLLLYFTPVMAARNIVIEGIDAVPRDEVVQAMEVRQGTPLLQIDTNVVADRIAAIRRVATVRVQRDYPSSLRVTVVERIPVAVKELPDGVHLYDRDGVDFATAPPPPGVPYFDLDNPGPSDPPTRAALQVLTALRPDIARQVNRVAAPSVASVTLTLDDGRVVVWGTTDRTPEKAEKLAALLTQPGRTYDVSSPDLPTVK
jgi:cell division protein FtsQ